MRKEFNTRFGELKSDISTIEDVRLYFDLFKTGTAMSDRQCEDLNIDDLFRYSNRCISPVGEMVLYHKFRNLPKSGTLSSKETVIRQIEKDSRLRNTIEKALLRLSGKNCMTFLNLLHFNVHLSKWHRRFKFLPIIELAAISLLACISYPPVAIGACAVFLILNATIHYWNKTYTEMYIRPLAYLKLILSASKCLIKEDVYNSKEDIGKSCKALETFHRQTWILSMNRVIESDWMILFYSILEFIKAVFLIEPIITNSILSKTGNICLYARKLFDYLGEWDVLYSISSLRVWLKRSNHIYSIPQFNGGTGHFSATDIYHPLIPDCVPNSIEIDRPVIITGSNMSGKSSFIKAIGVNIVTSLVMNTCFARDIRLPEPIRLHTVLAVSDDIGNGKSYYFSEVTRIKSIIDSCGGDSSDCFNVILIDEIFKGTDTAERISIANAVVRYFAKSENASVIVSTHDIEFALSMENLADTYHFSERVESSNGLVFDYRLTPGAEYSRNAISILENCGYPEEIVSCAKYNVSKICQDRNIFRA